MLQEKLQNSDEVETKLLSEPELLCFTYLKLLIWRSARVRAVAARPRLPSQPRDCSSLCSHMQICTRSSVSGLGFTPQPVRAGARGVNLGSAW